MERAIRKGLAAAGVAPAYVGDDEADALRKVASGDIAAASLYAGPRVDLLGFDEVEAAGIRILEMPIVAPEP